MKLTAYILRLWCSLSASLQLIHKAIQ